MGEMVKQVKFFPLSLGKKKHVTRLTQALSDPALKGPWTRTHGGQCDAMSAKLNSKQLKPKMPSWGVVPDRNGLRGWLVAESQAYECLQHNTQETLDSCRASARSPNLIIEPLFWKQTAPRNISQAHPWWQPSCARVFTPWRLHEGMLVVQRFARRHENVQRSNTWSR